MRQWIAVLGAALLCLPGCKSQSSSDAPTVVTATGRLIGASGSRSLEITYERHNESSAAHLRTAESANIGALQRMTVDGELQDGFAPDETYVLTAFNREVLTPLPSGSGNLAWYNNHRGDVAIVSFKWYDTNEGPRSLSLVAPPQASPDGEPTLQPVPRIAGAAYLSRHDPEHVIIPWRDPSKSLDMQRLTRSVFDAAVAAVADTVADEDNIEFGGLDDAGDMQMSFVPVSTVGRGFTYVFSASLEVPYVAQVRVVIPIDINLVVASPQGNGQVGYEADIIIDRDRVVVISNSEAASSTALNAIRDALADPGDEQADALASARIALSLGLYADYRPTLRTGAQIIVLPENPVHGIRSTQVVPLLTRIELHFLE